MSTTPAGIERLGVHLPRWALARADLAQYWSAASTPGSRSVANWDEDVITMGVEAALGALSGGSTEAEPIDGVLFATTSPVFLERQHAAVVAAALDLSGAWCLDTGGSLRSGIDALQLAARLVRGGQARRILVVAADRRELPAGTAREGASGDGAAAVVVSTDAPFYEIAGEATVADPAVAIWRRPDDPAVRVGDERFVARALLQPWLTAAAGRALAAAGLSADAVRAAVLTAPLPRAGAVAAKELGIPAGALDDTQCIERRAGYTGVAAPLIEAALMLPAAHPDDVAIVASAGDGASAVVGFVRDPARAQNAAGAVSRMLERARPLTVGMFQRFRGQVPTEPVDPYTSEMLLRREQEHTLTLRGRRCRRCGRVEYPPRRLCLGCGAKDEMDGVALPLSGTLYTHTVEHLFPVPENRLIMGVVELGGARLYTQVTDSEPEECAPGVPVDLVLRRLHSGGGVPHYFWKAKVTAGAAS